jgi:hypothetical protein
VLLLLLPLLIAVPLLALLGPALAATGRLIRRFAPQKGK